MTAAKPLSDAECLPFLHNASMFEAIRAAFAAGAASVPREPTQLMLGATHHHVNTMREIWIAMHDAATQWREG